MLAGRVTAAAAVFLLCVAPAARARDVAGAKQPAAWSSITTPIPRATLLAALDLDPALPRTLTLVEAIRRLHEDDSRRGTLRARLITTLQAAGVASGKARHTGGSAPVVPAPHEAAAAQPNGDDNVVPLPLTETFWESCILRPRNVRGSVGTAILTNASIGLMYMGLASTDAPTRLFLGEQCDTMSAIARAHAAVFATVARSVRVRDGRVQPPGGEGLPIWRRLALYAAAPSQFLTTLVSADAGRLAYFYDTIVQLDPVRQRFALGLTEPSDPDMNTAMAVYRVCADSDPSWSIVDRPFARMAIDVALVFQQVELTTEGRVAGPATEAFLAATFADGDIERGRDDAAASLAGRTVDAGTLARLVMTPDWIRRRARLMTLLFAQRVFSPLQPSDAAEAIVALRGIPRVETLPFVLERAGVRSPAAIAAAVRRALQFGATVNAVVTISPERQRAELSAFQSALVLVEHLAHSRAIDSAAATALILRVLDERPPDLLGFSARVARWIENDLLAHLGPTPADIAATPDPTPASEPAPAGTFDDSRERRLLDAIAGAAPAAPITVTWEGAPYRVDLASAERARLRAIRARQGGPTLDDALGLLWAARALRGTGDDEDVTRIHAAIVGIAAHLAGPGAADALQAGEVADARPVLTAAAAALEGGHPSPAVRVQQARHLAELGSTMLGDALRSIVYACALGDADGQAFLAGDVSRLHEFGLDELDAGRRRVRAWELPVDVAAGGQAWHLTGSLLAVDLAMSRFALRRALGEMPSRQPTLSGPDRRTLVAAMALMNAPDLTDTTRDALVQAMRRGRERLETALGGSEAAAAAVSGPGITGWRAQLLRWAYAFEPETVEGMVSRSELVWLGAREPLPPDVHAWGASAQPITGAWALRFPGPEAIDEVAGRQASGYLPARFVDLTLRLAEIMADLHVPAPLTREVLRMALQRFVDEARPSYPDDWLALVRRAADLSRDRVEDYIYALTVEGGPLVRAGRSEGRQ